MNRAHKTASLVGLAALAASAASPAHVSLPSTPGIADSNQVITFGVGHGCEGADTLSVRVELPPEVLAVRTASTNLGSATLETDDTGVVTAVTWEKPEVEILDADTNYYQMSLRIKVPNMPFSTLYFPAYQTCLTSDGDIIEVDWAAEGGEQGHGEDEAENPAPMLDILPPRVTGWNQYTIDHDIHDLAVFFADATIVWRGDAAYSSNPNTLSQIESTEGVSLLEEIEAGDEIWVMY